MQRLTLCVIAKDEEAMLGRCLASVRGLADAIVVVDTGSTDRTVAIAHEHGATLVRHAWQDDFSAARNAALEHVKAGFVLVLDADERLGPGAKSAIRQALRRDDFDCGLLALHDADSLDAQPTDVVAGRARRGEPVLLPRLLRRTSDLAWEGIIHEQVSSWAKRGRRIAALPASIVHYGAVPSLRKARAKDERNLKLLERRCEREPDDPTARAYLARELERTGDVARAWLEAERAWSSVEKLANAGPPSCDVVLPATLLSFLSLRGDRPQRALEVLARAKQWTEPHPNLDLLEGCAHEALALRASDVDSFSAELTSARAAFERCLAQDKRAFVAETMPGATSFTAHARLATVALLAGELELAASSFRAASRTKPDHVEAQLGSVEVLLDSGRPADALQELQHVLAPDCPDAWLLGSACAESLGHGADALLFLDRAREIRASRSWIAPHRRGRMVELETRLRPSLVRAPAAARTEAPALSASVVIPAYNRLDLLRPVLEGFLRERRTSTFELIVVDDGSTPPVQELADALGSPSELRVLRRANNGGRGAALNTGLDAARGDVVVFCDSDIVPGPGFVEEHLRFHRERADELATHLGSLSWGVDAGLFGALLGARSSPRVRRPGSVDWTTWFTDNWSFRRSLLVSRGLRFDEGYRTWGWEELDLARRLVQLGARNELTNSAHGLHLKAAAPAAMIENFARSVPNLLRLASSAAEDEHVLEWLSARCESESAWQRCRAVWDLAWQRTMTLEALAPRELRDVSDPVVDRLATSCSDALFRLGLASGFLRHAEACRNSGLHFPAATDLDLALAMAPFVADVEMVAQVLTGGSEAEDLSREAMRVLALDEEQRRAFQERLDACKGQARALAGA